MSTASFRQQVSTLPTQARRHGQPILAMVTILLGVPAASNGERIEAESVLVRLLDEVDVPARVSGVISQLNVKKGDRADERFELARIDDVEARLVVARAEIELQVAKTRAAMDVTVRTARAALRFARAEYDRAKRAADARRQSVSMSELEEKQLNMEQAEIELERMQQEFALAQKIVDTKKTELLLSQHHVRLRSIRAPMAGVVVEILRQPGEWVEPGEKVLRMVSLDRLGVDGFVTADVADHNLVGSPLSLTVELPGNTRAEFAGKVVFVSPEIDPVNRQVRVSGEVDNAGGRLRPGLRAKMTIEVK